MCMKLNLIYLGLFGLFSTFPIHATDWPQWAGPDRQGTWSEEGILERFPEDGLEVAWRKPIRSGYSAPVVADGRVFVMDYRPKPETKILEAMERLLCLDEKTGEQLWEVEWETHYRGQVKSYVTGPRAAPCIDGDRIYAMGAGGVFLCVDIKTGKPMWQHDATIKYQAQMPAFGASASPLVDGDCVIFVTGGKDGGQVKGFDKMTGEEIWRALPTNYDMPYGPPMVYQAGGVSQLIVYDEKAIHSLNPKTGESYWQQPFRAKSNMTSPRPVKQGNQLLVTSFYTGSILLELDPGEPKATVKWQVGGSGEKSNQTKGLHSIITTPIVQGEYFYGTCSYGELRGLSLETSERLWESDQYTRQGRWGTLFWVKNGERYFVNNGLGELMIMRFTPEGPVLIDRTKLIDPDTHCGYGARRFADALVNWVHPAYANRHIIIRNDHEILRASLAAEK